MSKYNAISIKIDSDGIPHINYQKDSDININPKRKGECIYDMKFILAHKDLRNIDYVRLKNNLFKLIKSNYIKCVYQYHIEAYKKKGNVCFFDYDYYYHVINKSIDDLIHKYDMVELNIKQVNIEMDCDNYQTHLFFNNNFFEQKDSYDSIFYEIDDSYIYDSSAMRNKIIDDLKMKESDWEEFESQVSKYLNDIDTQNFLGNIQKAIKVTPNGI